MEKKKSSAIFHSHLLHTAHYPARHDRITASTVLLINGLNRPPTMGFKKSCVRVERGRWRSRDCSFRPVLKEACVLLISIDVSLCVCLCIRVEAGQRLITPMMQPVD